VTNTDEAHLQKLADAGEDDVCLSEASPLGVPFWTLRDSASEEARRARIAAGKPGSACPKGYLVSDTEFTDVPVCHASRYYQKRKLAGLADEEHTPESLPVAEQSLLSKACICHDLGGGAVIKNGIDHDATTAVCCGPNIAYFSKVTTLEQMVSHIYGQLSLLTHSDRPHMFIRELRIYIDHLRRETERFSIGLLNTTPKYFNEFKVNLLSGIAYYRERAGQFIETRRDRFMEHLEHLHEEIERIWPAANVDACASPA
jgi:hypothetical protein